MVIVSYVLLWQVLVPTIEVGLYYGKMLSGQRSAEAGMNLITIGDQKSVMDRVKRMKDTLRGNSRVKLLEKIVPEFYHRNDEKKKESDEAVGKPTGEDERKDDLERHRDEAKNRKPPVNAIKADRDVVERIDKKAGAVYRKQQHSSPKIDNSVETSTEFIKGAKHGANDTHDEVAKIESSVLRMAEKASETSQKKDPALLNATKYNAEAVSTNSNPLRDVVDQSGKLATVKEGAAQGTKSVELPSVIHEEVAAGVQDNSDHDTSLGMKDHGISTERTLLNMEDFSNTSQCPGSVVAISTTLLIQCSLDRLWIIQEETCRRWKDPIVVVVYLTSGEHSFDELKASCPQLTVVPFVARSSEKGWHYPVNHLRNLGLDVVQTSHVIVVDADFVPSEGLHQTIREVLEDRSLQRAVAESQIAPENRDAIVVPAFERVEDCSKNDCSQFLRANRTFLPHNMDELQDCVISQNCVVFQSKNNWEGHYSTRSHVWLRGDFYEGNVTLVDHSHSLVIRRVPCFDSLRYEPYVVMRWCPSTADRKPVAPYYDERFYGYGKNKIQFISHLRFLGYQFSILPNGFIVHNPHPESDAKQVWNDVHDYKLHEIMDALYPKFLRELLSKYQNVTDPQYIVQKCKPAEKNI